MRLYEIASQVKVTDGERSYFYWVTQTRPEIAKRAALKKHRSRMGLGMTIRGQKMADTELTAQIMPNDPHARTLDFHPDEEASRPVAG